MTTSVDFNAGETPFTLPIDAPGTDWSLASEGETPGHQEINDRRASIESAEIMRLARAL